MQRYTQIAAGLAGLLVLGTTGARENPASLAHLPHPILAQAGERQITPQIIRRVERATLQLCDEVENPTSPKRLDPQHEYGGLQVPAEPVMAILQFRFGIEPVGRAVTTVVELPRHGHIQADIWESADRSYPRSEYQAFRYRPNPGFYGKDKVRYQVRVNGKTFRVSMTINVLETWNNGDSCPPPPGVTDRGDSGHAPTIASAIDGSEEVLAPSVPAAQASSN